VKRNYQVKVIGRPPFTMGGFEPFDDAWEVCFAIFGNRLEWVR
jgi:hypothetical protein